MVKPLLRRAGNGSFGPILPTGTRRASVLTPGLLSVPSVCSYSISGSFFPVPNGQPEGRFNRRRKEETEVELGTPQRVAPTTISLGGGLAVPASSRQNRPSTQQKAESIQGSSFAQGAMEDRLQQSLDHGIFVHANHGDTRQVTAATQHRPGSGSSRLNQPSLATLIFPSTQAMQHTQSCPCGGFCGLLESHENRRFVPHPSAPARIHASPYSPLDSAPFSFLCPSYPNFVAAVSKLRVALPSASVIVRLRPAWSGFRTKKNIFLRRGCGCFEWVEFIPHTRPRCPYRITCRRQSAGCDRQSSLRFSAQAPGHPRLKNESESLPRYGSCQFPRPRL